jgi:hypothetical protein
MTKGIDPNISLAGYGGGFVAKLRKRHGFLPSIIALIFCSAFLPMGLSAQSSPAEGVSTLRISTRFVLLDASITQKKTGETIGDLSLDDFLLEEDGITQRLTYLSQDRLS